MAFATFIPCSCRRAPLQVRRERLVRPIGRGFTLVEVIATIVILAVIGSIASRTVMTAMDGYIRSATQAQLHTELSIAMDRIEREMRKIPGKADYESVAPNITSVTASSIAWNTNYSLSLIGSELRFVENGAASAVLLTDVSAFALQTFNESNNALVATLNGAGCDPIRRISIQITIERAGITETLRSKIFVRSTMKGAPISS